MWLSRLIGSLAAHPPIRPTLHGVRVATGVFVGLLAATPTAADPIMITSGRVTLSQGIDFDLRGDNLAIRGAAEFDSDDRFWLTEVPRTYPLETGTVDLSTLAVFNFGFTKTVDGFSILPSPRLAGEFSFTAHPTQLTCLEVHGGCNSAAAPFMFTGHLQGRDEFGAPLFDHVLAGQGLARASFLRDIRRVAFYTYDFSTSDPVPEPATLLLLGTGLTGLLSRRWRVGSHDSSR